MSTVLRSARGASAYTRTSPRPFRSPDEVGFNGSDDGGEFVRAWSLVIDQLLGIRTLRDDWDGEGTEAPHPALVDRAITLAQHFQASGVSPPDRVHAGVNGTVYFEWHTPLGYREVEVLSPIEAESRWVRQGSTVTEVSHLVLHS